MDAAESTVDAGHPSAPAVKFCGLTRPDDAAFAVALGAAYVGVIFAGGPRRLTPERAAVVLSGAAGARHVGVFGAMPPEEIAATADALGLDVVQLHADPDAATVDAVRRGFGGAVWAAARCAGDVLPTGANALFAAADAVVLDAKVAGALGGTGVAVPWHALAGPVRAARGTGTLILAGGLTPENVAEAVRALAPQVVDVSSGVESAPGIKDHDRMRAFRRAVQGPGADA